MSENPIPNVHTALDKQPRGRRNRDIKILPYVAKVGLAGGVAGCAAKTLIAPLDRVKILFQASNPHFVKYTGSWLGVVNAAKAIRHEEGLRGLFRGHSMTLFRIFPYAAIKFVAYEEFRVLLIPSADKDTGVRRFLAGSFSGVTSVFFTYPLEVVRVRMAFGTRKYERTSIKEVFRKIYHEGVGRDGPAKGIHNFYRGFSPTLVGMFPYAGVSFWTHDFIGDLFRKRFAMHATLSSSEDYQERRPLTFWAELISGGIAGLSSQTASYPLEIIRRRMQVGGTVGAGKFLTMWETAKLVWTTSGVRGFFVGLSIGYIKIVPMTATSFFVYERMKLLFSI